MTDIITPPAIAPLPAPPDPNDRSTFNSRAYPWSVAQGVLATEVAAVAANVENNADAAQERAELAEDHADTARAWAVKTDGPVDGVEFSAKYQAGLAAGHATTAQGYSNAAAASALTALNAPGTNATSTSTMTISPGSKTLEIQEGKAFVLGMNVVIADAAAPATRWMVGIITAYAASTLSVSVTHMSGSGSGSDWVISLTAVGSSLGNTAAAALAVAAAAGTATTAARSDHVHPLPLGSTPGFALGAAAAGTSNVAARADHVHQMPSAAQVGAVSVGGSLNTPSAGNLTNCTADGTNYVGFRNIPQNARSAAYTLTLADAGKHILHPAADTTARTYTIPANASVAYPIGTALTFVNQNGTSGVVTIAITSDTMRLAGPGTTGSRTLARNGIATALKITATEWIISGTGLT